MAAVAERPSEHPLARAILKEAARLKIPVDEPDTFRYTPGKGVGSLWRGDEILVGNHLLLGNLAAGVHVSSEMAFILNSARLVPSSRVPRRPA